MPVPTLLQLPTRCEYRSDRCADCRDRSTSVDVAGTAVSPLRTYSDSVTAQTTGAVAGPSSALRHREFRLFWIGALISNTGTWLQGAAVPYVLFQLTDSNTWVGLSVTVSLLPGAIFGPLAGAFADRVDRRKMLFAVQFASACVAVAFAVMWAAGVRRPGAILLMAGIGGIFMGFGMPAWQGLIADLVPRESLSNAVTMNSMQFHGSRAIGPVIAGAILATGGPTWAFVGNAVSFVAVMIALWYVRGNPVLRERGSTGFFNELRDGLSYSRNHLGIATALVLAFAIGFLGNPIVQLAPAFSERIYQVDAGGYGVLTGAFGLGAALGTYVMASLTRSRRRGWLLLRAILLLGLSILGFGLSASYPIGLACVLVAGSTAVGSGVLLLTAVQTHVVDAYRGRVLGVYAMTFTTSYPLGALAQGALADRVGARQNELIVGTIVLLLTAYLVKNRRLLDALDPIAPPASVRPSIS
jgi:MFS family permease